MNTFTTKDKENLLKGFEDMAIIMPIIERSDPDFCAALLHRANKLVEQYGARHGVTPRRSIDIQALRRGSGGALLYEKDIKDVIINGPATIILWRDGSKTVIRCQDEDLEYMTPESGIAIAIMKKVFGNKGNYNNVLRRLVERATDK